MAEIIRLTCRPVGMSYRITQHFGENPDNYKRWGYPGHNGVDWGCPNNTPVRAAADGKVEKVGWEAGGYGNYVKLKHTWGRTYYAHFARVACVPGNPVKSGDIVGYSDNTGMSTGPHLHFGLKVPAGSKYYDARYKGYIDPLLHFTAVVPGPGPEPRPDPEPEPIPIDPGDYVVTTAMMGLNVRTGPGIEHQSVGFARYGTKLEYVGEYGDWISVLLYVHGDYVTRA